MKYLSEVSAVRTGDGGKTMIVSIPKAARNMLELDSVVGLKFKVYMDGEKIVLKPQKTALHT